MGFMVAAILLAMLGAVREWAFKLAPRLMSVIKDYPSKKDAEQNHKVYTELVEVRATADSDRSYVLRFHNGSDFLPDNPIWKVSCILETVRSGVSYGSSGFQNVLVSRIHNIIDPVIVGESLFKGVRLVDCETCTFKEGCDKENKHSLVIQVDEMDDSFAKFLLESHNVKTVVASGMVIGRKAFGMVVLDFCDRKLQDGDETMFAVAKACRTASRVQYHLQFQDIPVEKDAVSS